MIMGVAPLQMAWHGPWQSSTWCQRRKLQGERTMAQGDRHATGRPDTMLGGRAVYETGRRPLYVIPQYISLPQSLSEKVTLWLRAASPSGGSWQFRSTSRSSPARLQSLYAAAAS